MVKVVDDVSNAVVDVVCINDDFKMETITVTYLVTSTFVETTEKIDEIVELA